MNNKKGNRYKIIDMKNLFFVFFLQFIFSIMVLNAQVENVIVETYYISDNNDATDTTGGYLEAGSKTYRIYIDLKPGTLLKKVYGDANHALKISSTEIFFNNKADGQSFGKDFSRNRLDENTVALDSWLTLGQITRIGSNTCFGVLKENDDDGSFIGGTNNDGGSAGISGGLLINSDAAMGISLYNSDGFDTMNSVPSVWGDYGIVDLLSNTDSTIFGSIIPGNQFISNDARLQNLGVGGVDPLLNHVLVAQLTTKGEISFELNIEVEEFDGTNYQVVQYVANDDVLTGNERISPFLKYPQSCGCTDPMYVEYNAGFACENRDSCRTLVIFGCMDSLACNYDYEANYNISEMCCYPGYCNDRDISVVCPQLGIERVKTSGLKLYPIPASNKLTLQADVNIESKSQLEVYSSLGELVLRENPELTSEILIHQIDVSLLDKGVYFLRLTNGETTIIKSFIKD